MTRKVGEFCYRKPVGTLYAAVFSAMHVFCMLPDFIPSICYWCHRSCPWWTREITRYVVLLYFWFHYCV